MAKYTRNASAINAQLFETESGQIITKVPCKIQIPARFADIGLAQVGVNTFVYGCFAIINDNNEYAVCNVNTLIEINPFKTLKVKIDDVPYYEFTFEAGQVVIKTSTTVRRDTLMYNVIDELIFQGKVPWYLGYEDVGKLFDTAKEFANSNMGENLETIEFLAAIITRSKDDRTQYIRLAANSYSDVTVNKITYVPLKSMFYSVNSTLNKLSGSYFSDGLTSALVKTTDKVDKLESILRA
jgi:hypothetical protein